VSPWGRGALIAAVLAALALRITGWDRGVVTATPPEAAQQSDTYSFYHYHPDETTLIRAALDFRDPTKPPLTAYGTLPMYLASAAITCAAWYTGEPADLATTSGRRLSVYSVRALSILLSLAVLVVLWLVARSIWGEYTALLAVLLIGAVPLAIQQAHFYTVDAPFVLLAMLCLGAALRLHERSRTPAYLIAGLLIGLTAATRLNGLLMAVVLVTAHVTLPPKIGWRRILRRLGTPALWYAGLASLATLFLLQPHLLFEPESMLRSVDTNDFAYSVAIARGEVLRPWSLADMHTIAYLHFWTALWPQGAGWPMTLLLLSGWSWAVARGGRNERLVAFGCALFFLSIGGLHTKHVRYLLPLLAPLVLLAAHMVVDLCGRHRWRRWVIGGTLACLCYTWVYGMAFSRIYQVADVRTTAGDWIKRHVPPAAVIAIERGGFSLRGSFSAAVYQEHDLNTTTVFATRGYLTCGAAARYLSSRLEWADWVAIADVNRYRQYTAAADLYPVAASFYSRLIEGDLGFEPRQRLKVYPRVAGITFVDDDAEPSFLGFDHPAVHILQQGSEHRMRLASWREQAPALAGCADLDLAVAAQGLKSGDYGSAEQALAKARNFTPGLADLLQGVIHLRRGEAELAQVFVDAFAGGAADRSLSGVLLPWATATSLAELGMDDEAARILELGWERRHGLRPVDQEIMAKSYMYVAAQFSAADRGDLEERAYMMAADLWESPLTLNTAAQLVHERGAGRVALSLWERSLSLEDGQVEILLAAGNAAVATEQDRDRALQYTRHAAQWTLSRAPDVAQTITAVAHGLRRFGDLDQALLYLRRAGESYPHWAAALQAAADSMTATTPQP
jgi:4-amino-4-deoxy-L-arabinose transferase-like glycosyltransferase